MKSCCKVHHLHIITKLGFLYQHFFFSSELLLSEKNEASLLNPNHKYCLCILPRFSSHHILACISPNLSRLKRHDQSKFNQTTAEKTSKIHNSTLIIINTDLNLTRLSSLFPSGRALMVIYTPGSSCSTHSVSRSLALLIELVLIDDEASVLAPLMLESLGVDSQLGIECVEVRSKESVEYPFVVPVGRRNARGGGSRPSGGVTGLLSIFELVSSSEIGVVGRGQPWRFSLCTLQSSRTFSEFSAHHLCACHWLNMSRLVKVETQHQFRSIRLCQGAFGTMEL